MIVEDDLGNSTIIASILLLNLKNNDYKMNEKNN